MDGTLNCVDPDPTHTHHDDDIARRDLGRIDG